MAGGRPRGNPNIAEIGKATRFSASADAKNSAQAANAVSQERRRQNRAMRETLLLLASVPLKPGRLLDFDKIKSLRGIADDANMTAGEAIALRIVQGALQDDPECRRLFLQLTGALADNKPVAHGDNNILEALTESTQEDLDTDDLPEIQSAPEPSGDMVESS